MQLHLVLPGLVWPSAQARGLATDLQLPALATLLTHARVSSAAALGLEDWLGRQFGLAAEGMPHAALRRLGEDDLAPPEPGSHWLNADPVHLHFAREHLLLADASSHQIGMADARKLVAALNEVFGDIGQFEMATPERWYLRLAQPASGRFFPLGDAVGRPVAHFLPEGEGARAWQQVMNEAQIVLFNHPINQAREAEGRPTANSVWLWGNGELPTSVASPAARLMGAHPLLRGLARAAKLDSAPFDIAALNEADTFAVDDALLSPARYLDLAGWRDTLQKLETDCFAPLLAALKARRIDTLRISAPGDRATLQLEVKAGDLWRFWRRKRSLDSVLEQLA